LGFWSVFFSIVGLGFAAESMGLYAHELNVALAILCLLLGAATNRSLVRITGKSDWALLTVGLLAAGIGLFLLPLGIPLRFFAAALWFWGMDRIRASQGGPPAAPAALAVGCVLFGLYQICVTSSLFSWYQLQQASRWVGQLGTLLTDKPLVLGPTFNGVGMVVMAVAIGAAGVSLSGRRRVPAFLFLLAAVGAMYAGYVCLFAVLPHWLSAAVEHAAAAVPSRPVEAIGWAERLRKLVAGIYPLHLPLILPCVLAVPLGLYLRRREDAEPKEDRAPSPAGPIVFMIVACVIAIWALTNVPIQARKGPLQVAFFKEGFHNWMVPTHQTYGSRSAGMFGNLPLLMERMGWKGEIIPTISEEVLASKDILMIMNQKDPLPRESLEAVDRFLARGGSLLVLADHTFWKAEHRVLPNEPLETTRIRINFDSADYFIGGWLHSLQYAPHSTTAGLGDAMNESGCVVGASLDLRYPAAPLIIGLFGYSDPGVATAADRGFMGDLMLSPGEPLGDVVLVAAQNVGRGRVVVVGDTSGFVNAIATQSWPFVVRVFQWLGSSGRASIAPWRDALGILLLAMIALIVLRVARNNGAAAPIAAAVLLAAGYASHRVLTSVAPPPPLSGKTALVDLSHVGLHSLEGWRDSAINGVYLNLMREGYFAVGLHDFDAAQIRASDLLVTLAPTKPYTPHEVRVLRDYMEAGGTVLLTVGWDERAGAASLLDMAGLEIPHRPLGHGPGAAAGAATPQPAFWEAWPVLGEKEVWATLREEPVIVRKAFGRGQMIVIGDSGFLLNKNLEVEDGAILANVHYFRSLLGRMMNPVRP